MIVAAGWIGLRAHEAYSHLATARAEIAANLPSDLADAAATDPVTLATTIGSVQDETAAARADVEDPVYQLATFLPWAGPNLRAGSVVAVTMDDFSTQVLPTLLSAVQTLQPATLAPAEGKINLTPLIAVADSLQRADTSISQYLRTLDNIDRSALRADVGQAVGELTDKLTSVQHMTSVGARVARLAPTVLGAEGPRRYLVVFQNLAELRSTGGIFGSYLVLTADNGTLTVGNQGSASRDIGLRMDTPVAASTPEELALYGLNTTTIPMDVNFTPDFPAAAQNFAKMYQARIDPTPFDGVIALDPVALSYLMKGMPAVPLSNGEMLTSSSIVKLMLSDAYTMFPGNDDQVKRDAFVAEATSAAFDAIVATPSNPEKIVNGLRRAADERRVLIYSTHPDEESDLVELGVAGVLPTTDTGQAPTFGIFLSDRTYLGSKLGFYLSGAATLSAGQCQTDGRREVTVTMKLDYSAPSSGLPEHVSGSGPIPYVLVTELRVFAPTGGTVTGAEFNGQSVAVEQDTDLDRSVGKFTVNLEPGTTPTITLHFMIAPDGLAAGGTVTPNVLLTPGVHAWDLADPAYLACAN